MVWISLNKEWFEKNKKKFEKEAKENEFDENYLINTDGIVSTEIDGQTINLMENLENGFYVSIDYNLTLNELFNLIRNYTKDIEKFEKIKKITEIIK